MSSDLSALVQHIENVITSLAAIAAFIWSWIQHHQLKKTNAKIEEKEPEKQPEIMVPK